MKRSLLYLAMTTSLLFAAPFAQAAIIKYTADLNGSNESPSNLSPGTGSAVVIIDDVLNTMSLNVSFSGLMGNVTAAHIHCCTAAPLTGTAGVATTTPTFSGFPSGVTAGIYSALLDMTLATSYNPSYVTANGGTAASAMAALFAGISLDQSYFNIHTTSFPGGEIRGFLARVPEPATLALLGLGLAGIGYQQRRKSV